MTLKQYTYPRIEAMATAYDKDLTISQCDPEAAQYLLTHPVMAPKTTIMPLDVTHQVLGNASVQKKLLGLDGELPASKAERPLPTSIRALYYEILTFFAKAYADEFGLVEGPPLHDPLSVAACFEPGLFQDHGERFAVEVVTEGIHKPDLLHRADAEGVGQLGRILVTKLEKGQSGVRIPRSLDVAAFWELVDKALCEAEKSSPIPPLTADWWDTRP